MSKYHELDAPETLEGIAPEQPDRSELSFKYPERAKDTRPLIANDEVRYRLHDEALIKQRTQLHRYVFQLGVLFISPLAIFALLATLTILLLPTSNIMATVPLAFGGAIVWYIYTKWAYGRFFTIIDGHDVKGGLLFLILSLVLGISAPFVWWGATLANGIVLEIALMCLAAFIISLITLKIVVSIATHSVRATGQRGRGLIE